MDRSRWVIIRSRRLRLLVIWGIDNHSRDRLDPNKAITDALDPPHILSGDTERLTSPFAGDCPIKLDDPVIHDDGDTRARRPGCFRQLGEHAFLDFVIDPTRK